jgi:hypothetical protein
MNPFIQTRVGVFAAMGSKDGPPLICERICAAVCSRLAQDPAHSLDPDHWKKIVGAIPEQIPAIPAATGELTLSRDSAAAQLAKACVSPQFIADSLVDLSSGMNSLISQLPPFPSLNALGVALDKNGMVQISLTTITVAPSDAAAFFKDSRSASYRREETLINYSKKDSPAKFEKLFGSAKLANLTMTVEGEAPYYFAVTTQD